MNLDTQMDTNPIHLCRQQLWSKIIWKRKFTTPNFYPPRRLHNHTRLGGKTLFWNHPRLGPQKLPGASIHKRLHQNLLCNASTTPSQTNISTHH